MSLVNDVLDLSKIEAGMVGIERMPFDLMPLIEDVSAIVKTKAIEKGLTYSVEYQWPLPELIDSDSLRLKQTLVNLVSNAIKFTDVGSVKIVVSCDRELRRLNFSIVDSGAGISEDIQKVLFTPFQQGSSNVAKRYGGTGLGLAISKEFVKQLGGEISLQSREGVGSTFSFYIDAGDIERTKWIDAKQVVYTQEGIGTTVVMAHRARVLFADDAEDTRKLVTKTLNAIGLDVVAVEDGQKALSLGLVSDFDLIILDMKMPVMDGYQAASELRKAGVCIPIVAFSANSMAHEVQQCLDAGCTVHLSKPYRKDDLVSTVEELIRDLD